MTPTPEPTKDPRTMLATPIAQLLRSRKAVAVLAGVIINLLIVFLPPDIAPRFNDMRDELVTAVTILVSLLVGGISLEDAAANAQTPPGGTTLEESRKVTTGTPVTPADTPTSGASAKEIRDYMRPHR